MLRLAASLQQWSFLASLPGYSPLYIASSGMIWSIVGSLLFWGLWQGKTWAPRLAQISLPIYAGYYWFDRMILHDRQTGLLVQVPTNTGFALLVTVLGLVFCFWTLNRTGSILYFGDRHERTS